MGIAMEKPIIFNYLDLHSYLREYYKFRKLLDGGFSYEAWSMELNFNKSRSFLRMILIGKKKASSGFVEAFSNQNFATKRERDYFLYMVKYSQASSPAEKQAFSLRMIEILRTDTHQKTVDNFADFVSNPLLPRLLTLLSFEDLERNADTFSKLLNLTSEHVENLLGTLFNLGLAESFQVEGQTFWKSLNERFKIKDHKGSRDLYKFHEASLQDALRAFDEPQELRKYKSLLLPMSEPELQEFYSQLDTFASTQFVRFSANCYQDRRLFQVNFNIHPVAKPLEENLQEIE
jgi:uncharacterized protein (TIGR02147 family)